MGFGITWVLIGSLALYFLGGEASWSPQVLMCEMSVATAHSRAVKSIEWVCDPR